MSKSGLVGAGLLVALVVYACGGPDDDTAQTSTATASGSSATETSSIPIPIPIPMPSPSAPTPGAPVPALAPATTGTSYGVEPELATVTSVTDGDTFRVGDRRIRVIGIDSCEADTAGGSAATAAARAMLSGATVTLTREPGVDRDRYGREVRYVATASGDLGRSMVPADHTAVYEGGNNASAAYLAQLRDLDAGGARCGASLTTSEPARPEPARSEPAASAPSADAPAAAPPPASSGGPFKNCAAARAAGADPVYRGEPGYQPKLDRDGDGVGCE